MNTASPNIAVIGTGSSAFGVCLSLIDQGIKPTVICSGSINSYNTTKNSVSLSKISKKDLVRIYKDAMKKEPEKKSWYGSNEIYESHTYSGSKLIGSSKFFGGFSNIWGASIVRPPKSDLLCWGSVSTPKDEDFAAIMKSFPVSFAEESGVSSATNGKNRILSDWSKRFINTNIGRVPGASEISVKPISQMVDFGDSGCEYCGMCNHSCRFDAIFSSSKKFKKWYEEGSINLIENFKVLNLDLCGKKNISIFGETDSKGINLKFRKVYLCAGALNTTRLLNSSFNNQERSYNFQRAESLIVPSIGFFGKPRINRNTLSELLIDFRVHGLTNVVHSQLSEPNENVLNFLKLWENNNFFGKYLSQFVRRHLLISIVTQSSLDSNPIKITLKKDKVISEEVSHNTDFRKTLVVYKRILKQFGAQSLNFLSKHLKENYYVGGSIPRSSSKKDVLFCDNHCRFRGDSRLILADSSAFPSIPANSIGFLSMANGYKLARYENIFAS